MKNKKDKNKYIYQNIINITFIILCCIPLFFLYLVPIRGQKDSSVVENRALQKIPNFNWNKFLSGQYQDELEQAINDQLILSQPIKIQTRTTSSMISNSFLNLLSIFDKNIRNHYIAISDQFYTYKDSPYIIEKPVDYRQYLGVIEKNANSYNQSFKNIDKYLYFIDSSRSINFNQPNSEEAFNFIKKSFKMNDYDLLKIPDFETYKDYFYQTDHHWNYKGSYQGYIDIINMLLGSNEKKLEVKNMKIFDTIYYGSYARRSLFLNYKEKFTVYEFDLPAYKTSINGTRRDYSNHEQYYNDHYDKNQFTNHYAEYYGTDYAEVIYDFENESKENLLIISSSYSNSINNLVASHFNKTYVLDLRHYEAFFQEPFYPREYIKKNKIDKVILVGDLLTFTTDDFYIKEFEQ